MEVRKYIVGQLSLTLYKRKEASNKDYWQCILTCMNNRSVVQNILEHTFNNHYAANEVFDELMEDMNTLILSEPSSAITTTIYGEQ